MLTHFNITKCCNLKKKRMNFLSHKVFDCFCPLRFKQSLTLKQTFNWYLGIPLFKEDINTCHIINLLILLCEQSSQFALCNKLKVCPWENCILVFEVFVKRELHHAEDIFLFLLQLSGRILQGISKVMSSCCCTWKEQPPFKKISFPCVT